MSNGKKESLAYGVPIQRTNKKMCDVRRLAALQPATDAASVCAAMCRRTVHMGISRRGKLASNYARTSKRFLFATIRELESCLAEVQNGYTFFLRSSNQRLRKRDFHQDAVVL